MKAIDFARDDCQVGERRRSYEALQREWRCSGCGGRLTTRWSEVGWYIACALCDAQDFIHERELERQKILVQEMLANLPQSVVNSYLERRAADANRRTDG